MHFFNTQRMKGMLVPYDPQWLVLFEQTKNDLLLTLSGLEVDIQHIGSTAVAGLYAKPILDIDIIIENNSLIHIISQKLEQMGFAAKGEQGISGRFAFRSNENKSPLIHLYVCYSDSLALKNHLVFRNALLADRNLVQQYNQLKLALTQQKGMTRQIYTQQKTEFILSVLQNLGFTGQEIEEIKSAN